MWAKGVQHVEGSKPRQAGDRMAASYVNFYLPNGGVVVPQFGGEAAAADARWGACQGLLHACKKHAMCTSCKTVLTPFTEWHW